MNLCLRLDQLSERRTNMNSNYKLCTLTLAVALASLGSQARADIVVLAQHSGITAGARSDSSDTLTSWSGSVSETYPIQNAQASLNSTIGPNSLALGGTSYASTDDRHFLANALETASASTQIQFTVSTTATYHLASS